MTPLSQDTIMELLTQHPTSRDQTPTRGYPPPIQYGPLRWFDVEMRCAKRGCNSPTYCKVEGIPKCMMHALHELNDMLTKDGAL